VVVVANNMGRITVNSDYDGDAISDSEWAAAEDIDIETSQQWVYASDIFPWLTADEDWQLTGVSDETDW